MSNPYLFKSGSGGMANPMTTAGDMIYGGATGSPQRLAGSTATAVLTSNGPTAAPSWQFPSPASLSVRSVTTTDSPTSADDVLVCSGTSFTITLPTAVGISGKVFTIIHNGNLQGNNVYTLNTTSGQTIGGVASGTYKLFTPNERLEIVSNGANWIILNHEAVTTFTTYTPVFTSFGSCTNISFFSRRVQDVLEVQGFWRMGTVAASEAKLSLGLGISQTVVQVDTGKIAQYTVIGSAGFGAGSVVSAPMWSNDVNSISFANLSGSGTGNTAANANAISSSNVNTSVIFKVPIQGWQP